MKPENQTNIPESYISSSQLSELDISLINILHFLKSAWKTMAIFGLIGLILSIISIALTPRQFEATVQISMAQISTANSSSNNAILGANIEEPALLILRLSSPTSLTPEVIAACGLQHQENAAVNLSKSIKLNATKGLGSIVDLKTIGGTSQSARDCALGVFNLIKTTQAQIMTPYINEVKIKLADYEARLAKTKIIVSKSDNSGVAMSASYLSTRDEIRYLLDEIAVLKNVLISYENRGARMIAPIYSSDMPIAPKKRIPLAVGLISGLCLGLVIALVRQMVLKLKGVYRDVL